GLRPGTTMAVGRLSVFFALLTVALASCGRNASSRPAPAPASVTCSPTGTFHRSLDVGAMRRAFVIHVPRSYQCGRPMPLLVDFHGTTMEPVAEAHLLLDEAIAVAERQGFILVRPRSRSGEV